MWSSIVGSMAVVFALPLVAFKFTEWYSQRCVRQALASTAEKLAFYEDLARTYTASGTPEELRAVMEELEEVMDDLQVLQDNNPFAERKQD